MNECRLIDFLAGFPLLDGSMKSVRPQEAALKRSVTFFVSVTQLPRLLAANDWKATYPGAEATLNSSDSHMEDKELR